MMIARASVYRDPDPRDVHVWPLKKLSKACVVCCEGGNVLSCGGGNCSIVVHESCMPSGARLDKNGEFCCPYCFYKQSLIECRRAKEKTLLARKALSNFLDADMSIRNSSPKNVPSCNNIKNDRASHQPMQVDSGQRGEEQLGARLPTSGHFCAEGAVSKEAGNLKENLLETLKKFKDMNGEPMNKGSKGGLGVDFCVRSQTVMTSKNAEHPAETVHCCGRTEGGKSRETSLKHADKVGEKRGGHVKRTHQVRRKAIFPEKDAHPMRDTGLVTHGESEAGDHTGSSHHSSNTGTLKNGDKHEKLHESSKFEFSEHEDHEVVTSGRQIVDSAKWNKHPTLPKRKRSPLRWRAEEVDMLKEGVRRFSSTVNKNMSWRKILEYGRHVFDGTREPEDLREKWKKLSKRF